MAQRKYPIWAESDAVLGNGDANKVDPGNTKQVLGWIIERPLVQHMNWLQNLIGHFVKANNEIKLVASGYEAEAGETVLLDNSAGAATGLLPATPVDGQKVSFGGKVPYRTFGLTVNGNGNNIMEAGVTDLLLDVDKRLFEFNWNATSTFWEVSIGNLRGAV